MQGLASRITATPPETVRGIVDDVPTRVSEHVPHKAFAQGGPVVAANRQSRALFGYAPGALLEQPTERLDFEAGLATAREEMLGFHRLLGDLITRLLGATAPNVDSVLIDCLREVAETLHLDVAGVCQTSPDGTIAVPTHCWTRMPAPGPTDLTSVASIPWLASQIQAGKAARFARVEDVPNAVDRETLRRSGMQSGAAFPLPIGARSGSGGGLRAVCFGSTTVELEWSDGLLERLQLAAAVIGQALTRREVEAALHTARHEVRDLHDERSEEVCRLRREMRRTSDSNSIVLESAAIKRAFKQIECVAPMPATVLLLGETGSGKEVFAQAIHDLSPRHSRQMVKLNCAAIPSALIESELFGRERGAFTGAISRQLGRFEVANHSTLFLDEIGELPVEIQVKLLRVLQHRVFERLGSNQSIKVDVRIIAATNRNLEKAVENGTFREDLYYRLNVFPVVVPPLRERAEDIPGLVWAFIDEFSKTFGKPVDSISKESMRELQSHNWPGNVRELRNVIERALILSTGRHLHVPLPTPPRHQAAAAAMSLADLEMGHIRAVLESSNWRVRGAGGAAERLGLKPTTLESRMTKLGIRRGARAN